MANESLKNYPQDAMAYTGMVAQMLGGMVSNIYNPGFPYPGAPQVLLEEVQLLEGGVAEEKLRYVMGLTKKINDPEQIHVLLKATKEVDEQIKELTAMRQEITREWALDELETK